MIENENRRLNMEAKKVGAALPVTPRERFVNGMYSSVDEATACGLDRLRSEQGIVPTCKLGCCYCCRFHILMNVAEAHALTQFIRRGFSADQIDALRFRTQQWHAWDNSRPGRHPSAGQHEDRTDISDYVPCCPLLVNGACIAYPVRPVVCRAHYVRSHRLICRAATESASSADAPMVLTSIVAAASPFSTAIKDHIEKSGLDFSRSIMLLPHWLAIEMEWDFALPR